MKLYEINMASEAETTQPEKPVYKKIVEYKKKISLVEGKRRAMFNKYEQEKTFNREKERVLDTELKVCLLYFFEKIIFLQFELFIRTLSRIFI